MKIWIYSIVLSLAFSLPISAQQSTGNIESVKIAFITQKLELTADESKRFWPVYNNYQQELQVLVKAKNERKRSLKGRSDDNDPVDELKIDSEILELRKRYREEFNKVLPKHKAALVFSTEREFRQELIEHLQKRKQKN